MIYEIQLTDGQHCKRHQNQLRPRYLSQKKSIEIESLPDDLLNTKTEPIFNDDGCSIMFSSQVSSSSVDLEIEDAVAEVEFDCIVSDGDADAKYVIAIRLMSRFFASLPNFSVHQHQQAFTVKLKSRWPWFFLREQQLLLFFQYATHLATKWRNHLLSSTAELRLGDQSISINHLYSIIDNAKFTKIDHGLTKSDINPKDRQNFSSCVKLTSDDLFKI
ncbi:unnamed protein product [Rotaria socialis]|uniref:Uncharacterized protein n=1 Tax=Rotaria socialis TaxID=392032 RepID=A0A817SGF6_9BILA|nr:unnamed protein product [Rotaria socialis]CAF4242832.1 unnamed protein product [Rotaria socialis]